ncbi:DNA-binding transcriptional LysR family regulator [Rhizobium sp. BK650]|uniref:LysR family transcriptional regulator n=1 Tax=Rhizobium sp. BK650 TaxID=2586990 RepID=UPI00162259B8|nr:LysR family transcriptional regulator [Rhizobium sp. BK650]MBB3659903.1 DNA-binding transcriptional LysR family regulator [Rhizobium sp. BK650]
MFDEMRTFVLFAEEGSVQKVALRLPLTQPAVSRQIQRLEQALGVTLLDRRQKPPVLTSAGLDVLARSRDILAAFERMKAVAAAPEPDGLFRLGVAKGLVHDSLAGELAAATARFPKVSMRLKSAWSHELAEEFRLGHLDAALLLSDGSRYQNAEHIGGERLVVIGQAGVAADPEKRVWVLCPEPCAARHRLADLLACERKTLVIAAEVEDASMQLALVRKGFGLGLMPRRLFEAAASTGIEEISLGEKELRLDVTMLRSPHLTSMVKVADAVSDIARAFITGTSAVVG